MSGSRLAGRTALITGGGSGIGQAIATRFAREGSSVAVVDVVSERAETTVSSIRAEGGTAFAFTADVTDANAVEQMIREAIEAMGEIDILVNNAGLARGDDLLGIDPDTWDLNLAVVLRSVYLCTRAALPGMLAQGRGSIINMSSVNGLGGYGEDAYAAAKAGVINLTQNLAVRYGKQGIRANCIAPGTINTPIWQPRVDADPGVFDKLARWYPLGRVGVPEDVANAALFLASDEAAWITGAVLPVDGGLTAGNGLIGREIIHEPS